MSHVPIELGLGPEAMAPTASPGEPVYRAHGRSVARHHTTLITPEQDHDAQGQDLFITGASRGIGLAIALRAAA